MPKTSSSAKTLTSINAFVTSSPSTPGLYAYLCAAPTGISVGDVFRWDGSNAVLHTAYSKLPATLFSISENESYAKASGTWASESTLTVIDLVASQAALAGKQAGFYAATAAFGTVSKGDIVYYAGGGAACTTYIFYNDASESLCTSSGETLAKFSGGWVALSTKSVVTYSEPLTISAFSGTPTKGATRLSDYIDAVDDGSGWVHVDLAYSQSTAGTGGISPLVLKIPGGLKFNATKHPTQSAAATADNIQAVNDEYKYLIPCVGSVSVNNGGAYDVLMGIMPVTTDTFCLVCAGTGTRLGLAEDIVISIVVFLVVSLRNTAGTVFQGANSVR